MKRATAKLVELLPASRAANAWVMLALFPLLMFFGSMTYVPGSAHDPLFVVSVLVLSRLVSGASVLALQPLIFRLLSKPSSTRLFVLYLSGGLIDSVSLITLLEIPWVAPGFGLSAWAVISVSAVIVAAWFLMGHLALALLVENIARFSELQLKNAQLKLLTENATNELRRHQAELQLQISERVQVVLDRISNQLANLNFQSDPTAILETADSIRQASEADIRGLSHELSAPAETDLLPMLPKRKTNWREFAQLSTETSANIPWVATVGTLMALSLSMAVGGWLTALTVVGSLLIGVPALWLVDLVRQRVSARWPIWIQVICVPVEYVGMALLAVEIVRSLTRDLSEIQSVLAIFEIAVPVGGVFIWLLIFIIRGLSNSINQRSAQLEKTSRSLEVTLDRLQSQLREVRSRMARLLHGSVQGRLASVSLALAATAGQNDKALSDEMGFKAREQLELARKDLADAFSESLERPVFSVGLNDLLAGWSGLIDFEIQLDESIASLLDSDSFLGEVVLHAVQECFTNAVRHGSARNIRFDFAIDLGAQPLLKLTARNNGTFDAKEFRPGLGWQTMVADADSVEMSSTESQFQIDITWPLSLPASQSMSDSK
ncbi:MAG: hypothetical protein RL167_148 [Actinomycetota bacterium]